MTEQADPRDRLSGVVAALRKVVKVVETNVRGAILGSRIARDRARYEQVLDDAVADAIETRAEETDPEIPPQLRLGFRAQTVMSDIPPEEIAILLILAVERLADAHPEWPKAAEQ